MQCVDLVHGRLPIFAFLGDETCERERKRERMIQTLGKEEQKGEGLQ